MSDSINCPPGRHRDDPHDELGAARGILLGSALGGGTWTLLLTIFLVLRGALSS